MKLISDTVMQNRDLKLMLDSPIVTGDKKVAVMKAIFADKISDVSQKFIDILVAKHREHLIDDVAFEFTRQFQTLRGVVAAEVVSATALSDTQRTEMLALVKRMGGGAKADLTEKLDKDIIGGFILRVGDQQLDQSVSGRLAKYRQEFSKNHYTAEL